ncbi:hypothetical protein Enr13x_09660 [Stieleria neptunia]|uniref:Right handed beta helix domain-containing protein n=2 Tax=Stieleria neptunia TaxID=2527979 RepID=A0A518HJV4_9BACT|nr:hypothetical protein Enr13x_09660 [Stieleria neptunia]
MQLRNSLTYSAHDMKFNSTGQSTIHSLMFAALLFGPSIASAQSKTVRPPVVGDGKFSALPDDTVVPQQFYVERPTLNNAGFEWYVSGDENHNAKVTVRFREVGKSQWREGLPLLRIQREKIWGHEQRDVYETPNMFAGSLFGLDPDTTYECEFTMSDPDGLIGVATNTEIITTRAVPKPYEHGKVYHVYPLGYEGPRQEPAFTGLNEAYHGYNGSGDWWLYSEPRVKPGDTILVHAGLYKGERYKYANPLGLDFHGTYVLTQDGTAERPITIKAAGDGEVIFDGEGNYRLFDVMAADHHYFEGLTIVNTEIAFYAGLKRVLGCSGLSVVNCKMDKVGQGVMTHWAKSNDFYIADNTMIGMHDRDRVHGWARVPDPAPITSYNAVKVYGQGHVVCHNYIAYYHDAICIDTHGRPEGGPGEHCASIDFYNNDIFVMADNFIETDGGAHNLRVYDNRGVNVWHSALSSQPVFGGPAYFIRNVIHTSGDSLKFSARPTGMVVYNNTFCTETRVRQYSNGHFRNNLFMGHLPDQPTLSSMSYTSYTSFDYNGYRTKPEAKPLFQWAQPTDRLQDFTLSSRGIKDGPGNGTQWFQSLDAFSAATGQEKHGVMLDYDVFEGVEPLDPNDRSRVYKLEELDFRLREGSAAVDAGCELPTLTDGFIGEAPDLGAYERGKPLPVYGPRTSARS